MGPLLPSRNPPPHGTRHCHRQTPPCPGVRKLNFSTTCGEEGVHGEVPQRLALGPGEASGTNRCRLGIENVCATEQVAHELMTDSFFAGPRGRSPVPNCCTFT